MLDLTKLKELRMAKGLSQMKIASLVGVSFSAYIRWENNCSKPTPEHQAKLEEILL